MKKLTIYLPDEVYEDLMKYIDQTYSGRRVLSLVIEKALRAYLISATINAAKKKEAEDVFDIKKDQDKLLGKREEAS